MECGNPGLTSKHCCAMMPFPPELQCSNEDLVVEMISNAHNGIFPNLNMKNFNKCDPLPYKHSRKHFLNSIHGYRAIPILNVNFDARYCKLGRLVSMKIQWMLVIGHGVHTNIAPIPQHTRSAISTIWKKN